MLQKMKQFEGTKSTWRSWEFHWKAYLIAHDGRYRDFFAAVESSSCEVLNSAMSPAQKELSNQMYFMLAMAMPDDSVGEMILRNCPKGEGAAAWKRLSNEYSPTEPGDVVAQFRRVLTTVFPQGSNIALEISKLDEALSRYCKPLVRPCPRTS